MEETRTSGDLAPALTARITPQDPRYSRLAGNLFPAQHASPPLTQLLGGVGHELRTAAASLLGLGELWETGALGPLTNTQREAVTRVKECGEAVLRSVNDLLVWDRCEHQTLELQRRPVAALDLLQQTMQRLQPALDAKHHRLEIAMDLPLPLVDGDPELLVQALGNLLDNACRYTPAGGHLILQARRVDDMAEWEIVDDGPGLRVEEGLFDPAHQVAHQARHRTGGAGLGLAMARRIAELHGGSLELESRPGSGSAARLRIPLSCGG